MAGKFDRFLLATVLLDVVLLGVARSISLPISAEILGVLILFVVSPLLAYVIVYRFLYREADHE